MELINMIDKQKIVKQTVKRYRSPGQILAQSDKTTFWQ